MLIKKSMKTETNIQIFKNEQFGDIRTAEINGKIHFMATDVAKSLGYKNPRKAIKDHCKRVLASRGNDSLRRLQTLNFIPEGDVYRLIVRSELPAAEQFEVWLFEEVLPTIHKTGGYIVTKENDTEETIKARAMKVAEQAIKLHEERSNRLEVEKAMLIEERDRFREIVNATQAKRYQEAHEYNRRLSLIEMLDSDNLYRLKYRKKEIILDRIIALCFERGVYIYKDEGNPMHTIVPALIYYEVMEEYEKGKLD